MHVALAGNLASGKSSYAKALAETSGAKIASFGNYVRELTAAAGLNPADRASLQETGQRLVTQKPSAFFNDFLERYDLVNAPAIIFDGVRHLSIWQAIEEHARELLQPCYLVFVVTDPAIRRTRLMERGHKATDVDLWMAHVMEQELSALALAATVTVDGAAPMTENLTAFYAATAGDISD